MSRRWRGWSTRSRVERVELYTVQSLYVGLWGLGGVVLLPLLRRLDGVGPTVVGVLALCLALLLAATAALRAAVRLYPARGPLPRRQLLVLVGLAGVGSMLGLLLPGDLRAALALTVWGCLTLGLGGLRDPRVLVAVVPVAAALLGLAARSWTSAVFGLGMGSFLVFTVQVSLWLLDVVVELDDARRARADLAVAEERLRFSRDVHDVLGRTLSGIAVQAELAARLAERGDPDAPARSRAVQEAAHEALREARALARGYRAIDLDRELEGARALLTAAGIATHVDLAPLPEPWREPAAWVVRETVTNVLRHSRAAGVWIGYDDGVLRVRNDGVGDQDAPGAGGAGLVGLRERLAPLGADLAVRRVGGDFVVDVRMPG